MALKILWIIVGLLFSILLIMLSVVIIAMYEPVTDNDIECGKKHSEIWFIMSSMETML